MWHRWVYLNLARILKIACDCERSWKFSWECPRISCHLIMGLGSEGLLGWGFLYLRDGKIYWVVGIFWSWIKRFLIIQHTAWACDFRKFLDPSESGNLSADMIWKWFWGIWVGGGGIVKIIEPWELWLLDLVGLSYLGMKFHVHTPNHLEVWQCSNCMSIPKMARILNMPNKHFFGLGRTCRWYFVVGLNMSLDPRVSHAYFLICSINIYPINMKQSDSESHLLGLPVNNAKTI